MNKLYSKIAVLSASLALAVGVGVAVGSAKKASVVKAAEYTELQADFTLKTSSHSKYNDDNGDGGYWAYNDDFTIFSGANNNGGWSYVKMGGKSDYMTDYNPVFIMTTTATTQATIRVEVNILANTNSNKTKMGASWKLYVASDSAFTSIIDTVDKGTLDITTAALYTFEPTTGDSWAAGSFFKVEWTVSNSSTANGIVWLDDIKTIYEVSVQTPDSVEVSGDSNVSVGGNTTFSAVAKKSGSADGVDQNVVWSSSNENIAVVSSSGVVTGVHNGTATIRATAKEDNSVYGERQITVINGKSDNSASVLMPNDFPAGYGDNYITIGGVYYHAKQIMKQDGVAQFQKNNGLLENVAAFSDEIKTIELTFNSGKTQGAGYTVQVSSDGETFDAASSSEYKDANHLVYSVSTGNYFFKVTAPTSGTLYLDEILIGFGNTNEAKLITLATELDGMLDAECEGESDTTPITASKWAEVKAAYVAGDADAKSALVAVGDSGSYHQVNSFLSRYDHIVGALGLENFLERAVASSSYSPVSSNMDSTGMIIIIAASATSLIGFGLLLILKKRKVQK